MKVLLSLHSILHDLAMSRVHKSFFGMLDFGDFIKKGKKKL